MTELCVVTQTSDLLFRYLAETLIDPFIVVTDTKIGDEITARTGRAWTHMPLISRAVTDKIRDEIFYRHTFYPGAQLNDLNLDGMPLNRVLGLDRFRFWHYGDSLELLQKAISKLSPTSISLTLDINSAIPWLVAKTFPNLPVTLIKTENIRTREYIVHLQEFGKLGSVQRIIVSFEDEREYVEDLCPGTSVEIKVGQRTYPGFPQRKELRKSITMQRQMRLSGELIGIVYDERDNNAFLTFAKMMETMGRWKGTMIFPYTTRSHDMIYQCISAPRLWGVHIIDDPSFVGALDGLITTRYYENIHNMYGTDKWRIFDPGLINYSDILAPKGVEVIAQ